jgi:hypothetical protein
MVGRVGHGFAICHPSRAFAPIPTLLGCSGECWRAPQDLLQQRGGRSFPITDADDFFGKLGNTLEALRQASRPHPQSIELAVALAKRYCRDDIFAMEWVEYLHFEVEKIRKYINSDDYPKAGPAAEGVNRIIDTVIVRSEILRRACLICGRWGTPQANQAVVVAIQCLSFGSQPWSGYVSNESLREFASSICFYTGI